MQQKQGTWWSPFWLGHHVRRGPLRVAKPLLTAHATDCPGLYAVPNNLGTQVLSGSSRATSCSRLCCSWPATWSLQEALGLGVVEHPAEPADESAAAIWKLPAVLALLQAPRVERHRIAQGFFGLPSPKPTDLLVINMPHIVPALRAWMTRSEPPKTRPLG